MINTRLIRWTEALKRLGIGETSYRSGMANGTLPKPVQISVRAVGIPEIELNQVIAAMVAGLTDSEIKRLVSKIHKERENEAELIRRTLSESI